LFYRTHNRAIPTQSTIPNTNNNRFNITRSQNSNTERRNNNSPSRTHTQSQIHSSQSNNTTVTSIHNSQTHIKPSTNPDRPHNTQTANLTTAKSIHTQDESKPHTIRFGLIYKHNCQHRSTHSTTEVNHKEIGEQYKEIQRKRLYFLPL
jgi:hypothetical protein